MEDKFFKEIQKKMNVKTLKDFEKELRKKIRDEFEIERKTNPDLARVLLVTEANLWEGIKNGNYSWVKIDSVRKEKLFKLITLYKEFYNRQEEFLDQKSPKVIDRFVLNYLAVDNAGQTADNKHTGSMIFPFFLLARKTDKALGDDTGSEPVSKIHLLTGLFLHTVL